LPTEPISVLYADADLLVLEKPAGLLSVPGRGADKQDCLSERVRASHPGALVVHRLDMATSGLMLMARNKASQTQLGDMFAARLIGKTYVALVQGRPDARAEHWQVIDLPIAADWARRPRRVIDHANGKASQTRWRVAAPGHACTLPIDMGATLLELEPLSGRSHQLRVHLLAIGHPILGDRLYGDPHTPVARLMLHASQLHFNHPTTRKEMHFCSAVPF
jgi:tRNA pseudouridine32 synthase/23S rRNA pseudouridine746 synthase